MLLFLSSFFIFLSDKIFSFSFFLVLLNIVLKFNSFRFSGLLIDISFLLLFFTLLLKKFCKKSNPSFYPFFPQVVLSLLFHHFLFLFLLFQALNLFLLCLLCFFLYLDLCLFFLHLCLLFQYWNRYQIFFRFHWNEQQFLSLYSQFCHLNFYFYL